MRRKYSRVGYKIGFHVIASLTLGVFHTSVLAMSYQQDAATGRVVFESELADTNLARGGLSWGGDSTAGFSGGGGLRALPPAGAAQKAAGYSSTSPQLGYQVNFTQTGTHYVWIRGLGSDSASNSAYVGLNGNEVATGSLFLPVGPSWSWSSESGSGSRISFEVNSLGVHTVNVWMREAGFRIDKLVVTTDPGFIPTGTGPQASPRLAGGTQPPLASLPFRDNFNDNDDDGWDVASECDTSRQNSSSKWEVVNQVYMQTGDCRGFSPEGVNIGSYSLYNGLLPADVDIHLSVNSQDPLTDAVNENNASKWKYHSIGVMFGYQDANNYYLFEMDGIKGHRKLWRKQAGKYTELNTSPQSYRRGQWERIRIIHKNGVILVYVGGQLALSALDATFSGGQLGLFCARNSSCSFDELLVVGAPFTPRIGAMVSERAGHAYSNFFVDTDNILNVSAISTRPGATGGVEFVILEGGVNEQSRRVLGASNGQFRATFNLSRSAQRYYSVNAYLLDRNGVRMTRPGTFTSLRWLGVGGIHLYAMGDSITAGLRDDTPGDDISFFGGTNTGGGFEPVLNDFLSEDNGVGPLRKPVTVLNDGNAGETSAEGAARINVTLDRTPEVQVYMVSYGANDSGGRVTAAAFKANIQKIIDAVRARGKIIVLAKAPPFLRRKPNSNDADRDAMVREYNTEIDNLVAENNLRAPPDFYTHFNLNENQMSPDKVHPNGRGYRSMARIWCRTLNGLAGMACTPTL